MSSVTCLECKSEIPGGLDTCPECGFHFADAPPIKCPECSKSVVFTGGTCPECGFPYDALDELLLEEEVDAPDAPAIASQAEQLPAVAKHAAAASAAQSIMEGGAAVGSLAVPVQENAQLAALNELISALAGQLEEFKRSSDGTVGDLSAGVEKFLENVDKLRLENQNTLQGMQEIAGNFGSEMKTVVESLGTAKSAAVAEINSAAQQMKSAAAEMDGKVGGTVDYIFYISLAIVLFTALNMVVSMYVVKLVK